MPMLCNPATRARSISSSTVAASTTLPSSPNGIVGAGCSSRAPAASEVPRTAAGGAPRRPRGLEPRAGTHCAPRDPRSRARSRDAQAFELSASELPAIARNPTRDTRRSDAGRAPARARRSRSRVPRRTSAASAGSARDSRRRRTRGSLRCAHRRSSALRRQELGRTSCCASCADLPLPKCITGDMQPVAIANAAYFMTALYSARVSRRDRGNRSVVTVDR